MAARTGMATLISTIRDFCVSGTADYTLGTTAYWSDEHLQAALDRNKLNVIHEELVSVATYSTSGSLEYKDYYSGFGNYEETSGGTTIFVVQDGTGNAIGTALWSMDYDEGKLTFGADQAGSVRYITGQSYDIYRAASDVWRMKAGHHSGAVDFSTDNMTVKRGQMIQNDREQADYYANMGRVKTIQTERSDTT